MRLVSLIVLALMVTPAVASAQESTTATGTQGVSNAAKIILVRGGANAEYLWNASDFVATLVKENNVGEMGMRQLEVAALEALIEKARASTATTVTIQAYYDRGTKNLYQVETAAGAERVVALTADREALLAHGKAWTAALSRNHAIADVKIRRTGSLPPAH